MRKYMRTLEGGLKLYKVRLVGGSCNGGVSICSGDIVWQNNEKYIRGKDDRYYYEPQAGGKN